MLLLYSFNIFFWSLFLHHLTSTLSSSEIYRQKLQQCLTDGELSDDDVAALLRLRVMLCVPQQTVDAAHAEICGTRFEKVIQFMTSLVSLSLSFFSVVGLTIAISPISLKKNSC